MSNQSVLTAFRVLETVAATQPVGLSELARATGLSKTTVQRSLVTLAEAGWLARGRSGSRAAWSLTPRAYVVGSQGAMSTALRDAAMPILADLQRATGETIHLSLVTDREVVLVERLDSAHELRTYFPLGLTTPLHATASGKAALAALEDAALDAYLASDLEQTQPRTVVDRERIRADVERIRIEGFATVDQEWQQGVTAVAATARVDGAPFATVSISAPSSRVDGERIQRNGALVVDAAARLARVLASAQHVATR